MRPSVWALALGLLLDTGAAHAAGPSGHVFLDRDGDGRRGADEPGVGGVRVTNGRDVVATDIRGRYALPERDGFVYLTRPDGYTATDWYRRGAGDFALSRTEPASDGFFFVQISDVHAYERTEDYTEFSSPPIPGWMPQFFASWLILRQLRVAFGPVVVDEAIVENLRESVAP